MIIENLYSPNQKFNDQKTLNLIRDGKTKGAFQLESILLSSYSKKLKPDTIEDLSLLISCVRPGTLEVTDDATGLNMAQLLCARKNHEQPIIHEFPILAKHLEETYGVIVYQEQIIEIVKDIGGFSLQDADALRKACGKKLADEMAKVKLTFIKGCEATKKVNAEDSEKIWSWIEKSQRYLFNRSHGMSYAMLAYITLYFKAHYPEEFYIAWLRHSKEKSNPFEEVRLLVNDAKANDFEVLGPRLSLKNELFEMMTIKGQKFIAYGLSNIRNLGKTAFSTLQGLLLGPNAPIISDWDAFCFFALMNLNHTTVKSLICSGAIDEFKVPRQKMLYEYNNLKETLTDNDLKYMKEQKGTILERLETIKDGTKINNRKLPAKKVGQIRSLVLSLKNPPYALTDSIDFLAFNEELYLGISLSCSAIDDKNVSAANCSVGDLAKGQVGEYICVGAVIDSVKPFTLKKGKNKGSSMAFISISDGSGVMESVAFAEVFKEYESILTEKNTVLLRGKYQREKKSFIIEKAWQV